MSWKYFALYVWIAIILALVLLYFFAPEFYYRMFYGYQGPGSPFVNPPAG